MLSISIAFATAESKVKQRSTKEKSLAINSSGPKSAIIAIQIIDEADEKAGGEKSKRTIDSALGHGYQSLGGKVPPPKFMIYKYSQHDIPPYNGPPLFKQQSSVHATQNYNSVPPIAHVQPGMTLFSTINQNGHVGTFSTNLPQGLMLPHASAAPIPVIILRILPAQLQEPTGHLYPNIPSSNSFASIINSLDIKALLSGIPQPISTGHHSNGYQAPQSTYSGQTHGGIVSSYLPKGTNSYSQPVSASLQVGSHHRYTSPSKPSYIQKVTSSYVPSKAVSFMKTDHGYMYQEHQQYPAHQEQQQQQYYQQQYQEQPQYPPHNQYQEQQYSQEQHYPQEQDYQQEQQYSQEQYQEPQQYHTAEPQEDGRYQQEYQQQYSNDDGQKYELLTHENYPSDKHTKVIFKHLDGRIRSQTAAPIVATTHSTEYSNQNLDYGDHQPSDSSQYDYETVPRMELKKLYYAPANQKT